MKQQPRSVAWDEDFWVDGLMSGSAHYVSGDRPDEPTMLLVPDRERGGFKEHQILPKPKGRMGF